MILLAVLVIVVAVVLVLRGIDVRLVLLGAALLLGALAGDVRPIIREFLTTFSNEKFVVPICSAMGFAYVLKLTQCDMHMVRLLTAPLSRVRFLMVPGVVGCGFLVNIPVISQASTAVCLGTVVVPLMRAAGYSSTAVGATLLVGASVGGELLNPGAPELNTVAAKVHCDPRDVVPDVIPIVLPVLIVAGLALWLLTRLRDGAAVPPPVEVKVESVGSVNLFKAAVPLIPLAILFASGPPLSFFAIEPEWVVAVDPSGKPSPYYSSRLIGLAMLIGTLAAAVAGPRQAKGCMKAYFEGAGYGFTNIVSLIVTATCFGKGIEAMKLADHLGDLIAAYPGLLHPLAGFVPMAFGWVSGSGMASTQSLYGFFYEPTLALEQDPKAVGAMVSVGAAVGRTMSPVAAVVLMCASLTGAKPIDLVLRVCGPLLFGLTVAVLLRTFGVL